MTLVLVVDDVPALAQQYAYDLKRVGGYEVVTAAKGSEMAETFCHRIGMATTCSGVCTRDSKWQLTGGMRKSILKWSFVVRIRLSPRHETAREMLDVVEEVLPADAAVFAAAVADWRVTNASASKMKKDDSGKAPDLQFAENPDILATISRSARRPGLVVGFAAETDDVMANAMSKRTRKGCDWIVANDVSTGTGIMGGSENAVTLITEEGADVWPRMSKHDVARQLAARIAAALAKGN